MSVNREVENEITKIMGSYLLKGYTLLDTHCSNCQTPLMRTKTSNDYCIYCNEVEVKSKAKNKKSSNESSNVCAMIEDINYEDISKTRHRNDLNSESNTNRIEFKEDIERTVACVQKKINWATERLNSCDQISDCMQLINLLKSSADLIIALNQLSKNQ